MIGRLIGCLEALNQFVPGSGGGYFYLLIRDAASPLPENPLPTAIVRIGNGEEEKMARRLANATEKAFRLARNPDHQSSWQSRDAAAHKWGGAVRIRIGTLDMILSFSGHPEEWDEALVLSAAKVVELATAESVYAIAHETTRPCLDLLMPRTK